MLARSATAKSALLGSILMLISVGSACSSQSGTATTSIAATLPADFSVPQINFSSLAPATQTIDCAALVDSFVGLASDPVAAQAQVLQALQMLARTASSALAADLDALATAVAKVSDQASAATLLATPELTGSFGRVQDYVQTQCPQP